MYISISSTADVEKHLVSHERYSSICGSIYGISFFICKMLVCANHAQIFSCLKLDIQIFQYMAQLAGSQFRTIQDQIFLCLKLDIQTFKYMAQLAGSQFRTIQASRFRPEARYSGRICFVRACLPACLPACLR